MQKPQLYQVLHGYQPFLLIPPNSSHPHLVPGVTGGEEDGVDNTDVDSSRLYTQPEEVWQVYETLSAVPNGNFTVAAAFGNVHGVYAPGNVPSKTRGCKPKAQPYSGDGGKRQNPNLLVNHGGPLSLHCPYSFITIDVYDDG